MNTNHGVLTTEGIFHAWENHYATMEIPTMYADIESLMYLALTEKFTHLWIHPSTGLTFTREQVQALLDTQKWDVGVNGKFISVQKNGKWKGYVASVVGRSLKPYPTKNTRLIFIEQGNWPFNTATPEQILRVSDKVETGLDVAMAGSPTSVGLRYLEKMNKRYYDHYFEKSGEVDWLALKESNIPGFAWFPTMDIDDTLSFLSSTPYVHCFDRNGSHPAAAAQENMGVGTPFVQEGGEFNKKKVGLWDVEVSGQAAFVPPDLLPLFPKGDYWLPTPLLRIAEIAGYSIKVNRAMLWPEGKPIFERWAKALWAFREEYPDGSMERQAFKSIMNNPIGSTRIGEEMDRTLRPDWYAIVVGSERAVVWYKAWKLAKESNVYPCGAYADALYYLSFERDPRQAVPGMLNAEHSLGGYKHVWTLPVGPDARTILTTMMPANTRLARLKKLVKHG